jgi:hypothetical protein
MAQGLYRTGSVVARACYLMKMSLWVLQRLTDIGPVTREGIDIMTVVKMIIYSTHRSMMRLVMTRCSREYITRLWNTTINHHET